MSGTAERMRAWNGPAILSFGFRPFFLGAALWAALAMALWIAMLAGLLPPSGGFAPVDWHVHALLYGYLPAVLAGFLLTAVPNWTGRLPVVGWPLLGLFSVWLAGRAAVTSPWPLPRGAVAVVDVAFLAVLGMTVAREILAGKNWRNLPVLLAVGLLGVGNAVFHVEATQGAAAGGVGARIGIGVAVFLILLVGGRIVPSFTRNWLAQRGPGRLPSPMDRFDAVALATAAVALLAWLAAPEARVSGAVCLLGGSASLARLGRWAGWRTGGEPLVVILHLGYLFVPLGFVLVAISILLPGALLPSAALHGWTAGAVGVMTLAVMTRASLGHTGRPLVATPAITAIYAAAIGAALLRVASGLMPAQGLALQLSGALWILAFGGFAVAFFGPLTRPRLAAKRPTRLGTV